MTILEPPHTYIGEVHAVACGLMPGYLWWSWSLGAGQWSCCESQQPHPSGPDCVLWHRRSVCVCVCVVCVVCVCVWCVCVCVVCVCVVCICVCVGVCVCVCVVCVSVYVCVCVSVYVCVCVYTNMHMHVWYLVKLKLLCFHLKLVWKIATFICVCRVCVPMQEMYVDRAGRMVQQGMLSAAVFQAVIPRSWA